MLAPIAKTLSILTAILTLTGCQTQQDIDDPVSFGRADCRRLADHPEIARQFELDSAVCDGRAQAAGLSGTASMWSGSLVTAIDKAVVTNNIALATVRSCMAERGYLLKRRSEHLAMCAVSVPAPALPRRVAPAPAPKRSAGKPVEFLPTVARPAGQQ